MIPHVFHRIWLGDAPIPSEYENWWKGIRRIHPGWRMKTWRDADLGWLRNRETFESVSTWSERSDVARYEIIERFGGVYVDCDVQAVKPLGDLLTGVRAFAGWEFSNRLCTAVLGAEPKHPAFTRLVDNLPAWAAEHAAEAPDRRTGPFYLTTQWWKQPGIKRFHRNVFYPVGWWEREKLGGPYPSITRLVHHWAGSWVDFS